MPEACAVAVGRLIAYLDEMDRVDSARAKPQYHDIVHAINDFELRRSDLRLLIAEVTHA